MKGAIWVIVLLVVAAIVAVAVGWVNVSSTEDRTTINVEREKIEHDTKAAAQKGEEAVRDLGNSLERTGEKLKD